jgi:hypothetical protein
MKNRIKEMENRIESLKESLSEYEINRNEVENSIEYNQNVNLQIGMINGMSELLDFLKGNINYTLHN